MTEEQKELLKKVQEAAAEELNKRGYQDAEAVRGAINKHFEGLNVEQLKTLDPEAIRAAIDANKAMADKLATIEMTMNSTPKVESIRAQIEEWGVKNKEILDKIRGGEQVAIPTLQLRAAITMTNGASLNSSSYLPDPQILPGYVDLVRTQPTFWSRLKKSRIKANPLIWVNKTNKQGNASFIGEGVLKPLASFELSTETSNPKKVAERMKVSTELLYDYDAMATMILEELRFEVEVAANTAVLTGSVSSTVPAGVTTIASAYALTTVETDNPTYSDAIRAAIAQIRAANFGGVITAYINPIDGANMDLAKASTSGVYLLPPFASADGRTISGVTVIEDNNIPVGYLLIGDMDKYKVAIHQDFHINWGWENDDFSKNLVTAIGEMRIHQWMSANHTGAIIYDAFADIIAAITP